MADAKENANLFVRWRRLFVEHLVLTLYVRITIWYRCRTGTGGRN
jgi:hypothetical protein